ncbi:MAG TPA: hypothetical protein VM846_08265, partial [Vicinamibacterales bacterium]|nr:hypothetical protein [Vicinamibacterales bacterium]
MPRLGLIALLLAFSCPALAAGQEPASPKRGEGGKPVAPKPASPATGGGGFRVCADPENMPFSNDKGEGFENKIAALVAKDFGATPSYIWWGQRRGFIRNTMNATLKEGRCDFVIGVPANYDLVSTTRPYYRSTYMFVYAKNKGLSIRSLDDQVLKKVKIGVHLLGDDY